jgi:hypothetical protein
MALSSAGAKRFSSSAVSDEMKRISITNRNLSLYESFVGATNRRTILQLAFRQIPFKTPVNRGQTSCKIHVVAQKFCLYGYFGGSPARQVVELSQFRAMGLLSHGVAYAVLSGKRGHRPSVSP